MGINMICADAVKWANGYEGDLFHALLSDPPYHLLPLQKRWANAKSLGATPDKGKDGMFGRVAKGFMGATWDGGDVAFDPATWESFAKVMYPGAFGMAFASSRGWHRLACAIEDGGLIIHPSIFGWAYGSGFPKATRVKADGFDGHRYGLQALKPALEPIIVFQKPYEGRPVDNITETGAGVLNIDGGRIPTNGESPAGSGVRDSWREMEGRTDRQPWNGGNTTPDSGRWPANFVLLDDGAAQALDRQSGTSVSGEYKGAGSKSGGIWQPSTGQPAGMEYGDAGGASRFFFRVQESIDTSDPVYYCAKASTEERDAGLSTDLITINDGREKSIDNPYQRGETLKHNPHPTVKPIELARYLATLLLPPTEYQPRRLFIPFAGVASEVIGSMQAGWDEITGIELTAEYMPIAKARIEYWKNRGWQTSLFEMPMDHPAEAISHESPAE